MLKYTRIAAIALMALAVVLALVALMVGRSGGGTETPAPLVTANPPPQGALVVEAASRLAAGSAIERSQLRLAQRDSAPADAYLDVSSAVGLVPLQDIGEGSVVLRTQLAQGFALQLQPGERALAVAVDEVSGAGNRILPGDFVDVFLNLKGSNAYAAAEAAQARLLVSRLRVLSYGAQNLQASAASTTGNDASNSRAADIRGDSGSAGGNTTAPARSAVLAVPVAEANRLLLGAQQGTLVLALRNPADTGTADPSLFPAPRRVLQPSQALHPHQQKALLQAENTAYAGIDEHALAGRSGIPAAASPPSRPSRQRAPAAPRAQAVEIIRGASAAQSSGSP